MEEIIISNLQKDALQEIANIGASHAATALSQMVQKEIKIFVPKIDIVPLDQTIDKFKNEETIVAIFLKISDEIPSYSLLLLTQKSAFALADILLQQKSNNEKTDLTDMEKSALEEVGNIMMCAFFDSIAELLHIPIVPGPPALAYDMPSAVLDYVLIHIGAVADKIFVFDTLVEEEKEKAFGISLFLVPEPKSITVILEKIGMANR
jgi:chemotaxis protein CheC